MKVRKIIALLLSMSMLAGMSVSSFADDGLTIGSSDEIKVVNFENGIETYEEYATQTLQDVDLPGRAASSVLPASEGIDPESYQHFEEADLLKDDGSFNWEAYAELPTLDEEIDTYSVIGKDDRVAVTNTDEAPYCYTAYLLMSYINKDGTKSSYRGTGFVAGENMVVTCGHNIYSHDVNREGWANSVTIILQKNGNVEPWTTTKSRLRSNSGWTQKEQKESDWGIIETTKNLADYVGYGVIASPSTNIVGKVVEIPGYPKVVKNETNSYKMWTDTGTVSRQDSNGRIHYDVDTSGGNSGSGVFINGSTAVAVHAYGGTLNSGARIAGLLYNLIMEYR